ncbi:hypothetical protein L7F22_017495 [Adiantum nelumboides]|nr:hypothetical protein [Adiantum nelumboides]
MAPFSGVHLHHIARETDDVQGLVRFYEEVLGFKRMETPSFGEIEVVWLSLPPSFSLHVIQRNPEARLPESPLNAAPDSRKDPSSLSTGHHLSFCVADFDACIKILKERQIPIYEKSQQNGKIKQAFFFDPDGNGLEIGNWPTPSS